MADTLGMGIDSSPDPVIDEYTKDVDRTLIRENLAKSYEERVITLENMLEFVREVQRAGKMLRDEQK